MKTLIFFLFCCLIDTKWSLHSVVNCNGAASHICMVQPNQYAVRPTRCIVWLTQCAVQLTQSVRPPPYMEKNKLILNQYLGIFMHFFRPTHYIWKIPDFFSFFWEKKFHSKWNKIGKFSNIYSGWSDDA